jgi:hypothetical protein
MPSSLLTVAISGWIAALRASAFVILTAARAVEAMKYTGPR